jgi:hypothetical protein
MIVDARPGIKRKKSTRFVEKIANLPVQEELREN